MKKLLVIHLKPYWRQVVAVVLLVLIQAIANLYLPDLNAKIINNGVALGDTGYIARMGGVMLAVSFLVGCSSIAGVYFGSRVAMSAGRDIRAALFRKVETFSQAEINRFGTPSLINRNTNDVQHLQMLVAIGLTIMVLAPAMMVGGVIMAVRQDAPLSLILAVIVPLIAGTIGLLVWRTIPLFRGVQGKLDRINQVMRETLAGIRVIRAFVRTASEQERFEEANLDLMKTSLKVMRIFAFMMPVLFGIFNLSTLGIMYFGGLRVSSGAMPVGNLTAFITYVMQILMSVMMATMLLAQAPRAVASAERIQEVLDVEPSVVDPPVGRLPTTTGDGSWGEGKARRGVVAFRKVEFSYPGAEEPVLRDISFVAEPGAFTAVVGSTGCGKSTLLSLIPRFYDVTGGAIEIDGVDIREMALQDLWRMIGFAPQRAYLFSGTVASNLRFGNESATDAELWHALEIAQAREFVAEMPGGLEAPIEQGGVNLSGGQRQRLAIARALVRKSPIYLFDDSFSALDFATDARLRAALRQEARNATVLIVAQRVASIMQADQILVLDEGTIVGKGTHQELLVSCDCYREIVYSQLSAEEVA